MDLQERLIKIEEENNRKKNEKSRLEGRLETLKSQAEEEFGTSDLTTLETKLKELNSEIETKEKELEERIAGLENYAKN